MPQYLVSGYLPDNFDPSTQDEAMIEEIHALNREMIAAGVRKFACDFFSCRPPKGTERHASSQPALRSGVCETRLVTNLKKRRKTSERRRQASAL